MVRVTVLGSGDAFGSGGRGHSAYVVNAPGATFLLDCGPSILQSLKRHGQDPGAIDFVLLSHLHGDHFGGVPFLLMQYLYEEPRTQPLTVYGPPGTERRVRALFATLYERSAQEPLPFALHFVDVTPGMPVAVGAVQVLPFLVPHAAELVCLGYRVEVAGRSLLYSGDAGWTEQRWRDALAGYYADHTDIGTGPDARGPALLVVDVGPGRWRVRQILDDPAGDHDWGITADVDLAASDAAGTAVLRITAVDQL